MNPTTTSAEMFGQFADTFTRTMRAGLRMNEETLRFWSDMSTRAADTFRDRVEKLADEATPLARDNAERFQRLFETQSQRNVEALRQGFATIPNADGAVQAVERGAEFCKAGMTTLGETTRVWADACQTWFDAAVGGQLKPETTSKPKRAAR